MITKKIIYTILLWLLFGCLNSKIIYGQAKTNVVTKEVNRTFQELSKKIIIYAEKAEINIYKTNNDKIELNLKLISKNSDIAIAKNQLNFLKYIFKESRNEISVTQKMEFIDKL